MARNWKSIKESMLNQLDNMGAREPHFEKLVDDAIYLWKTVDQMKRDIRKRGRTYTAISSTGKEYEKDNPDCKLLPQYVRQLQSLLKDMGLTTENVLADDESEADYL